MRTLIAVILAFVSIFAIGIWSIAMRPAFISVTTNLNTTIYDEVTDPGARDAWDNYYTLSEYMYWLIPALAIIGAILAVWFTAQQKEYVTGGYYT